MRTPKRPGAAGGTPIARRHGLALLALAAAAVVAAVPVSASA
jgi:hypothetical protein